MTHPEQFVASLEADNTLAFERLAKLSSAGEPPEHLDITALLRVALKNELEAAEIAAVWLADTPELDVKLALARQCGDEAKHYRLIAERLEKLGVDTSGIDPRSNGYSPLFKYLSSLHTTIERIAAGQFTREGIAVARNQCFIEFCRQKGDAATAALYSDVIQPDENHHHQLGRRLLIDYARNSEQQEAAAIAARRTIELAEEIQELARLKAGISRAPGC